MPSTTGRPRSRRSLAWFPAIRRGATDDRNYVKKAVSWALRQIGKRNLELNAAAIAEAEILPTSDVPSARWVGRDALRELRRDETQRRLRSARLSPQPMTASASSSTFQRGSSSAGDHHHGRGRPDVAEHLAVHASDLRPVLRRPSGRSASARRRRVRRRATRARRARSRGTVASATATSGSTSTVGPHGRRAGDQDPISGTYRPAESDRRLERRTGRPTRLQRFRQLFLADLHQLCRCVGHRHRPARARGPRR